MSPATLDTFPRPPAAAGFAYLASPYWSESIDVRIDRAVSAREAAADLMLRGVVVFSPVSYGVAAVAAHAGLAREHMWKAWGLAMLTGAAALVVLRLPGWEQSRGVNAEIAAASGRMPVAFADFGYSLEKQRRSVRIHADDLRDLHRVAAIGAAA